MRIDPHAHSTASDGTQTPVEVMRAAAAAGLDIVGLADHDTTTGWAEAAAEAEALGIGFLPAVEVSCRREGRSIHLLALWPSEDESFLAMLHQTREARVDRARLIVERIARDHPLAWDAVAAKAAKAETVGRPHIADVLVDLGIVPHRDDAFSRILATDSPYFVPHYAPDIAEAIAIVREAGGVPVLAHPGADGRTVVSDELIADLAGRGLVGLEIDHRDHSAQQKERLALIGEKCGLVRTGGSDYHGAGKRNRLGENLTSEESYEALLAARS